MDLHEIRKDRRGAWLLLTKIIIFAAILAVCGDVLLRVWISLRELVNEENDIVFGFILNFHAPYLAAEFAFWCVCLFLIFVYGQRIGDFIYRWRYVIAAVILAVCVSLELSGSSIHCWADWAVSEADGVLLGTERSIRSDEWALNTAFAVSQTVDYGGDAFSYYSDIIRGASTDTFIVYGQPVLDIAEIFRPFHWGYLLFGAAKGLSFFWCSRLLALILVSFELGMLVTGKKRLLSLTWAGMLTFSSLLQWWFAINGLVEMLVFSFAAVLLLHRYMHTESCRRRIVYALLLTECACGFVLAFYPAWMVPVGYLLAGLGVWVIVSSRKTFQFRAKKDLPILAMFLGLTAASLAYVLIFRSWDTVQLTLNSVYPGRRLNLNTISWNGIGGYVAGLFTPLRDMPFTTNNVEYSSVISLMPLGVILSVAGMIRRKRPDSLAILLMAASVPLTIFVFVGMNETAAKLTGLSFSTAARTLPILHLLHLLLLFRAVSRMKKAVPYLAAVPASALLAWLIVDRGCAHYEDYMTAGMAAASGAILFALTLLFLRSAKGTGTQLALGACAAVICVLGGVYVNPVQQGISELTESASYQMVEEVVKDDPDGLWIVENTSYPRTNLPITAGAPTINSTNTYPNLERWELLDPDGSDEEIYNRYAHIRIDLVEGETQFVAGETADAFTLKLSCRDLKTLGVSYIFAARDLSGYSGDEVTLVELAHQDEVWIYRVEY